MSAKGRGRARSADGVAPGPGPGSGPGPGPGRRRRPRRPREPRQGPCLSVPPLPRCCVPGCRRSPASAPPGTVFHPLPASAGPRHRWSQAILGRCPRADRRRAALQLQRLRKPFICSDHFRPGEVITPDTLPSIFPRGAGGSDGSPPTSPESSPSPARVPAPAPAAAPVPAHPPPAAAAAGGEAEGSGEASRGRIGDLVLAAELMEMVSETVQHVQQEERFDLAFGHDHGAYVVPDDLATLKKMVKGMKDTVYSQNARVGLLQRELSSTLGQYQELKERYESERWTVTSELASKLREVQMQNAALRCQRQELEKKQGQLQARLDSTSGTVLYLSRQLKAQQAEVAQAGFCLASVQADARCLRFYTGFESRAKFDSFLRFVTQDAELCAGRIRAAQGREGSESGPHPTLSHGDQLLLVLSRLRLGLLLQDLAFRFRVSETTVSRVWLNWTEVIHARLTQIPITCSAKYVESFEPKRTVKHREGETLTVLDCADLLFEAQAKERGAGSQRGWAQPYRRHYARRGYAVASPRGYLTFATGGPGAEKEGEDGQDQGPAGMKLPGFFSGGPLTEGQQELSRQVLSVRSHVDKVLTYRFLRGAHSRTMERQVDRAWVICCYLACINHRPMGLE